MASDKNNLQDAFLNNIRKNKIPVTIYLMHGVRLQGILTWFDSFCLLLKRDSVSQLVYKHSISTIMPAKPLDMAGDEGTEAPDSEALPDEVLDENFGA